MTAGFAWVVLPLVALPWPYVVRTFIFNRKPSPRPVVVQR
jgi:hypothetical protein